MKIVQGDVMLIAVSKLPTDKKKVEAEAGRHIIAAGEATGHHHAVLDRPGVSLWQTDKGTRFLSIKDVIDGEVELTHQEHDTQVIPKGDYEIRIQRQASMQDEPIPVRD